MSDHSFRANVAGIKGMVMAGGERLSPGVAAWASLAAWHRNGRRLWLLALILSLGVLAFLIAQRTHDIRLSFSMSYQSSIDWKPWLELAFQCLVPFITTLFSAIFYASRRRSEERCREHIALLSERALYTTAEVQAQ